MFFVQEHLQLYNQASKERQFMALSTGSTLADYLVPAPVSRNSALLRDAILVIGSSIFLAICAQISIHLPISPVPFTLQTLAVVLIGAALGSKRGALAVLLYLAEGAAGLPVFEGFAGGFIHLIGYTGGYLWAFPIAAFVTGLLSERGLDRSFQTSLLAMLPATLIIYALGVPWLAVVLHMSLDKAFMAGAVLFVIGDLIKLLVATALLPSAWSLVRLVRPDALKRS
jgi:biotin transport system substrate-specific component